MQVSVAAPPRKYPRPVIDDTRYWTVCTVALVAALLLFVFATFEQHGISNDEPVQHTYGRLLLDFYRSGFRDHRAFDYLNLHLYGGLFDIIAALLEPLTPLSVWDLRHLLTAFTGVAGIVAAALLARRLAGPRAGLLAALLLTLTGAWSGAMFTHTKDIPFGAAMIWALYYTTRLLPELPKPRWSTLAGLGLSIGAALGLRVGGLFAILYLLGGIAASLLARTRAPRELRGLLLSLLPRLLFAAALTLVLMAVSWPWSVMGWRNLFDAATKFSHFSFDMLTILDGTLYKIGAVPPTYLSQYLLIRLPELLLLGLLVGLVWSAVALYRRRVSLAGASLHLPLLLAAGFPVLYSLVSDPALYNGVRHFTFVIPPLAVVSGIGLERVLTALKPHRMLASAFAAVLLLVGAENLLVLIQLHPYQYVAYNHLVGGWRGAYERFEGDYWNDSLREGSLLLNHLLRDELGSATAGLTVAVCGESVQATTYLDPRFRVVRDWPSADFFLSSTQTRCDRVMGGTVIGEISREGRPLAVIKDRRGLVGHERRILGETD